MYRLLIFGGTTEGRRLAEFCAASGIPAAVSVATDYGASLLPQHIEILSGRRDADGITALLTGSDFTHVIDATHPYAEEATANIRIACKKSGLPYLRLIRDVSAVCGIAVYDTDELVHKLNAHDGVILSTLGSKLLPALTAVQDYGKRIWVRVLAADTIVRYCTDLGFSAEQVIAETPPFSVEQNLSHIRKSNAKLLVTKESGKTGGYPEKCEAAKQAGITLVTLCRRQHEQGMTLTEIQNWLNSLL